ncbi:uncharacterized protein LOC131440543 [Malaya genurostris]|uniref:uncharacterized protein LOC131440543 n=1 Tax=Malaya genurostris TaxID=325434 RepID=UPI0026F3DBD1|nr:uncharacterized protein LOC131440543 [Malaya genurostris]
MGTKSETVSQSSQRNALVQQIWIDEVRGLRKELINFSFISLKKPTELSRCLVTISEVSILDTNDSKILRQHDSSEQWIDIGKAVTPVDCYIEQFLNQMLSNEKSRCTITSKSNTISFTIQLHRIEDRNYYFEQSAEQMLIVARQYKRNGVEMFPKYHPFAHRYFSMAARCLLSCIPLETPNPSHEDFEIIREMQSLLETLYLNISACLIKQSRYEEVLDVLEYIDHQESPSEKAVYRKALAYFHLRQFQQSVSTLCRIDYTCNKDCLALYRRVKNTNHEENIKYNNMIKKMFA